GGHRRPFANRRTERPQLVGVRRVTAQTLKAPPALRAHREPMEELRRDGVEDSELTTVAADMRGHAQQDRGEQGAGHAPTAPIGDPEIGGHVAIDAGRGQLRRGVHYLGLGAGEEAQDADGIATRVHRGAAGKVEPIADVPRNQKWNTEVRLEVPYRPE